MEMENIYLTKEYFQNTSKCIIVLDHHKFILKVNPAFYEYLGYGDEDVIGKSMDDISSRSRDSFYQAMWAEVETTGLWEGEVWNRKKTGEMFLEKRTIIRISENSNSQYVFILEEITDYKIEKNKAEKINIKDQVTDLPSRNVFQKKFSTLIKQAKNNTLKPGVIMMNIERFQQIDKTFGFSIGDELLLKVTERFKLLLPKEVFLSRIGGGLFVILIPDATDKPKVSRWIEKVLQSFRKQSFQISEQEVFIALSIGVSVFPEDGVDERELLRNADFARYRALEAGDNNYVFYEAKLNVEMFERLVLETSLKKALDKKEFVLYYQPQIDIDSGAIVGVEALIRWKSSEYGLVAPFKFIPLAEETGLINPIGEWVLEEACRQNKQWQKEGKKPIHVAVNLSIRQFQKGNIVQKVGQILKKTGLDPQYLELEITESMFMDDVDKMIDTVNELKKLGVQVSIDDFGTGYSSLSYLAKLPIDTLKIDRSFIQNITRNQEDTTIVSVILAMAHRLKLQVVAEGVEELDHLIYLKNEGCERYQGYYFKPPIPAHEIYDLLP